MAEELASSPLSSPPESVINVAINSPVKAVTKMPPSSPHQEAANETVEVATAQPATTKTEDEAKPPTPHDSDDGAQSSTQKRKASISRKAVPSKKPRRVVATPKKTAQDKKWEAPFVYTDSRSRLADADLRAMLLHPDAWDVLTQEEKQEVLALFPDDTHILDAGTANARPNPVSLRNDDNFRHDCARYCENIELGRHDEEWLSQAWTAHEKHKRGDFDAFLRDQFKEDWDTELPDESKETDAEPAESKTDMPESADTSSRGVLETIPSKPSSRQSSRSSQSAPGGGSPQNWQKYEGPKPSDHGAEAKQRDPTCIVTSNPEEPLPTGPPTIGLTTPPEISQKQEAAMPNITVPSD